MMSGDEVDDTVRREKAKFFECPESIAIFVEVAYRTMRVLQKAIEDECPEDNVFFREFNLHKILISAYKCN